MHQRYEWMRSPSGEQNCKTIPNNVHTARICQYITKEIIFSNEVSAILYVRLNRLQPVPKELFYRVVPDYQKLSLITNIPALANKYNIIAILNEILL